MANSRFLVPAIALGVIVLVVVLVFPTLISAPSDAATERTHLETDESESLGAIEVTIDELDTESDTVTVILEDDESTETATLSETESEEIALDGGEVTVSNDGYPTDDSVVVSAEFGSTHGWSDESQLFADQFGLLFGIIALLIFTGLIIKVTS